MVTNLPSFPILALNKRSRVIIVNYKLQSKFESFSILDKFVSQININNSISPIKAGQEINKCLW